jgi:hypothetical protein
MRYFLLDKKMSSALFYERLFTFPCFVSGHMIHDPLLFRGHDGKSLGSFWECLLPTLRASFFSASNATRRRGAGSACEFPWYVRGTNCGRLPKKTMRSTPQRSSVPKEFLKLRVSVENSLTTD